MRITVTKTDISKGKPRSCEDCPLALAVSRAFKRPLTVGFEYIHRGWLGEPSIKLPPKAFAFREAFDAGKPVKPFSFTVNAS